jgi:hypothetical protein
MSDWLPIHKGGKLFEVVEEMGSGLQSTVGLPGEQFYAWYHVHEGTVLLVAGEAVKPENWTYPPPNGVVRIQRRGVDGISTTIDNGGRPYWTKLSPLDDVGPTLEQVLLEVATELAANLSLPLPKA